MTDILRTASDWLGRMFQQHASRSVIYSRDSDAVEIKASVGRTIAEVTTNLGISIEIESRDFIFPADQLVLGDGQVEPQAGDRITELQDSVEYVYEVMPLGKTLPVGGESACFRYCDADHSMLRVHTKQVDRN